jgi:CBS-domain-containing membrane protein
MNSAIERLLGLRVSDVMNTSVRTISVNATMAEAAATLAQHEISGAPVVDPQGHCVGILSVTDFALRELRQTGASETGRIGWEPDVVSNADHKALRLESYAEDRVEQHMSPAVQTINQTATLINAARVMCREHIHRLVIIDAEERPVGMISSLDLVAAMVAAVEE